MDKIADLLAGLAAKLGTTVERLWPILLAHKRAEWAFQTLAALITLGFGVWFLRWCFKKKFDDEALLFTIFGGLFVAVILGFCVNQIGSFADFIYPEPAVIRDLMRVVGK